MICPGVCSCAVMMAASPIGPAPTTATVSPGWTRPLRTPTSYAVGRMSARNSTCSSVNSSGHLVDGRIGERDPRELGLQAIDQVAEDPAAAARAEAVARLLAEATAPARGDAGDEHAVAGREGRHRCADLDDRADGLVAEDRSRLHLGHVALEDVQIGAADRRRVDADDRIRRLEDGGSATDSQARSPGPCNTRAFMIHLLWSRSLSIRPTALGIGGCPD